MENIAKLLRLKEWYDSKVPMLMSILLYFYILNEKSTVSNFFVQYICYFIFIFLYLAFGYVINDYADMEIDRIAGKQKVITHLKKSQIILAIVILILLSVLPILIYNKFNFDIFLWIFLTFLLGASYSTMPFRFKEKGSVGLVVASTAQRCLPLLVARELIQMSNFLFVMWMLLSFILGIRYILIHQILDYENDKKANVVTFTTENLEKAKLGIYISFGIEIICLIIVLIPILSKSVVAFPLLIIYSIILAMTCMTIIKFMNQNCLMTFSFVPLEDLYNIYLPIYYTIYIAMKDSRFIPMILITLIYLSSSIRNKMSFVKVYIFAKMKWSLIHDE